MSQAPDQATTTLVAAMQEQIRQSLPAHLSEALQLELKELARLRANVEPAKQALADLRARFEQAQSTIETLETALEKHVELAKREEACIGREIRLEISDLKVQMAFERVRDLKEITNTVFRSRVFTERLEGYTPVGVPSGGYPSTGNTNTTRTVTEE